MQPTRRGPALRPVIAVVSLLVGIASFGVSRVVSGAEQQPWADGGSVPASVHVSADKTYSVAVPGGVDAMIARGVPVASASAGNVISLQCSYSAGTTSTSALSVTPESTDTKAENTVGHFIAPTTGNIRVDCDGWGAMFVPDSDDRPSDWAGWALVLAVVALSIGACLAVTEVRLLWDRTRASRAADEHDKIQRLADVTMFRSLDGEVHGADGGDSGS